MMAWRLWVFLYIYKCLAPPPPLSKFNFGKTSKVLVVTKKINCYFLESFLEFHVSIFTH